MSTPARKGRKRQVRPCPARRKTLADRLPIDSTISYARKVYEGNRGKVELGEAIVISICAHFQSEGTVTEAELMAAYKLVMTTMFPNSQVERLPASCSSMVDSGQHPLEQESNQQEADTSSKSAA